MVFSHIYLLPSPSPAQQHQETAEGRCTVQAWQAREGWERPGPSETQGQAHVVLSKKIRHSLITQSEINDRQPRGHQPRPRLPAQWSHTSRGAQAKGAGGKSQCSTPRVPASRTSRSQLPCYRGPHPRTRWVPGPPFQESPPWEGVSPSSALLPAQGGGQFQLPSSLKSFIAFRSLLPGPRYGGEGGKPSSVTGAGAEGTH